MNIRYERFTEVCYDMSNDNRSPYNNSYRQYTNVFLYCPYEWYESNIIKRKSGKELTTCMNLYNNQCFCIWISKNDFQRE